jgi:hypothetical protein
VGKTKPVISWRQIDESQCPIITRDTVTRHGTLGRDTDAGKQQACAICDVDAHRRRRRGGATGRWRGRLSWGLSGDEMKSRCT